MAPHTECLHYFIYSSWPCPRLSQSPQTVHCTKQCSGVC